MERKIMKKVALAAYSVATPTARATIPPLPPAISGFSTDAPKSTHTNWKVHTPSIVRSCVWARLASPCSAASQAQIIGSVARKILSARLGRVRSSQGEAR